MELAPRVEDTADEPSVPVETAEVLVVQVVVDGIDVEFTPVGWATDNDELVVTMYVLPVPETMYEPVPVGDDSCVVFAPVGKGAEEELIITMLELPVPMWTPELVPVGPTIDVVFAPVGKGASDDAVVEIVLELPVPR